MLPAFHLADVKKTESGSANREQFNALHPSRYIVPVLEIPRRVAMPVRAEPSEVVSAAGAHGTSLDLSAPAGHRCLVYVAERFTPETLSAVVPPA